MWEVAALGTNNNLRLITPEPLTFNPAGIQPFLFLITFIIHQGE